MVEEDIKKMRELIQKVEKFTNKTEDDGLKGQWNTYQYVANSEDTKAWAAGIPIGATLVKDLNKQQEVMLQYINLTLEYLKVLNNYVDSQEKTNNGKY